MISQKLPFEKRSYFYSSKKKIQLNVLYASLSVSGDLRLSTRKVLGESWGELTKPGFWDRAGLGTSSTSRKRNLMGTRLGGGALQAAESSASCILNQGKEETGGEVLSPRKPLLLEI